MLRINGKIPTKAGTELAEHNIVNLCKIKNYKTSSQACLAWLRENNEGTFYDLEKIARDKQLELYFIASPECDSVSRFSLPNQVNDDSLKYQCKIFLSDLDTAMEEIKKYSKSYDENLEKLKETGFTIPRDCSFDELLSETEQSEELHHKIMHNKIEIDLIKANPEEELKNDIVNAYEYFKVEPRKIKLHKTDDGYKIYGFGIKVKGELQIISQYGIIRDSDMKTNIVLINDSSTWNFD